MRVARMIRFRQKKESKKIAVFFPQNREFIHSYPLELCKQLFIRYLSDFISS